MSLQHESELTQPIAVSVRGSDSDDGMRPSAKHTYRFGREISLLSNLRAVSNVACERA